MTQQTLSRVAYDKAWSLEPRGLAALLQESLGVVMTAQLCQSATPSMINAWVSDGHVPPGYCTARLRVAAQVVFLMQSSNISHEQISIWFQEANPMLNKMSPLRALRESELSVVGSDVISAAVNHINHSL